jgi:carboxyl-terminal processing protease
MHINLSNTVWRFSLRLYLCNNVGVMSKEEVQKISLTTAIIVAAVAVVVAFGGGVILGGKKYSVSGFSVSASESLLSNSAPLGVDFSPVWKAWEVIDEKFVSTKVEVATTSTSTPNTPTGLEDPQLRVWGMVQGLAASLDDPYTVFLPPSDAEIFEDDISGAFEGVGMEIAIRDSVLTVVSPLKGTPAFRAGLKSADRIISIDGNSTKGMDIGAAVKRIRGPKGTVVTFEVIREGAADVLEIEVTRDTISIPTLDAELREDGIFKIELLNFSAVSPSLFRDALREFVQSGSDKLLLDLRGNPGGFLGASVDIASWFLQTGKVVVTEDYGNKQKPLVHRSRGYNIFNDNLKMVILVDRGSASASEILAGALQSHRVAQLVGTNTFGKGSVQELVDITSDTSLKITVARWLTPSGDPIPNDGIAPDIEVKVTQEDIDAGDDPQLEKAVEILLGTSPTN